MLVLHTRKQASGANGADYVASDMRGTSATHDAVRALRLINHMSQKEAEAAAIPEHERTSYIRVDRGKGNNSPPAKAVWRRIINVDLPNGDEVGAVVPWNFPGQDGGPPTGAAIRVPEVEARQIRSIAPKMNVSPQPRPYAPLRSRGSRPNSMFLRQPAGDKRSPVNFGGIFGQLFELVDAR